MTTQPAPSDSGRLRSVFLRIPLRYRLPASFAGVALLTMLVLGAILIPILDSYYGRSEVTYLQAGAERAAVDLDGIDWDTIVEAVDAVQDGTATSAQTGSLSLLQRRVEAVALATQVRVQVLAPDGSVLVDSGDPDEIDLTGIVAEIEDEHRDDEEGEKGEGRHGSRGLPSPVGGGLLGGSTSRQTSDRSIETALSSDGQTVAVVRLSDAPAYGAAVVRTTVVGWSLAGVAAVILAALVGWLTSRRITRPLLAMTAASERMVEGDLSARVQVDRRDEIGTLAHSFNDMAGTVEHTVSALRRFVADAAHELGTPLTALETDIEMAQTEDREADRQRLLAKAMEQAERLDRLSANLLLLSRLDAGSPTEQLEPLDPVRMLRDMADSFASRAEQLDISFELDLSAEPMTVEAQPNGLRTAVENLLDNALKFTPAGGSVLLGARREGDEALLWVTDTGIGIPPQDMEGLFARFHRGRNAAAYPGSGLGLAIVRATMDLHRGRVSAESGPTGTRFELHLPLWP